MIIAIDFDGTIAEHSTEGDMSIGPEVFGAIDAIKTLQRQGHTLILWTCREGKWLDTAVQWLVERDIIFNRVNENVHSLTDNQGTTVWPRKVFAHIYVDDRSVGGFRSWPIIMYLIGKEYAI